MAELCELHKIQRLLEDQRQRVPYLVPDLWLGTDTGEARVHNVNPYDFFRDRIRWIISRQGEQARSLVAGEGWSEQAITYNLFVRLTTAWDHNGNGVIDTPLNDHGWRETGTFLKSIALLPYIKTLGCNTIHLLPIMAIGLDGRKGTLGSPYAVRNQYVLDENLSEPALDVGVDVEFKAFMEAAHQLGMRVVLEFALRTVAKDADWVAEHPEWFYWIRADLEDRPGGSLDESQYGQPIFTDEEQTSIEMHIGGDRRDLLPPHDIHRCMFVPPPLPETLAKDATGRWIGQLADETKVRIPAAFTDWPLVANQPPWTDVTYLKLYEHPSYNYLAYNTIRNFDYRLDQPENRVELLWEQLTAIIPYYQQAFGIDGAMLDLGHCLPTELKHRIIHTALERDPSFAFWAEDFDWIVDDLVGVDAIDHKLARIASQALMGPPIMHNPGTIAHFLHLCQKADHLPLFMLTAENHNTPRAASRTGGNRISYFASAVSPVLPGMPWLHSGFELAETRPVNPVVCSDEEMLYSDEQLPLFSPNMLRWTNAERLVGWVARALDLRTRQAALLTQRAPSTLSYVQHGSVLLLSRHHPSHQTRVVLIANTNLRTGVTLDIPIPLTSYIPKITDSLTGETYSLDADNTVSLKLDPGQCLLFEV